VTLVAGDCLGGRWCWRVLCGCWRGLGGLGIPCAKGFPGGGTRWPESFWIFSSRKATIEALSGVLRDDCGRSGGCGPVSESRASSRGRPGLQDRLRPCRSAPAGAFGHRQRLRGPSLFRAEPWPRIVAASALKRPSVGPAAAAGNPCWLRGVGGGKIVDGGSAWRGRLQLNRGMNGFDFGG
jgi:hypothetical protein